MISSQLSRHISARVTTGAVDIDASFGAVVGLTTGGGESCITETGISSAPVGAEVRTTHRRIPMPFKQCCCLAVNTCRTLLY